MRISTNSMPPDFRRCLLLCWLAAVSTATALQSGDFTYEINSSDTNTVTITGFTGTNSVVNIPDNIEGKSVTIIGESAFHSDSTISSVVISDSVIYIGNYAFSECYNLTNIAMTASVTNVGSYAFEFCNSLPEIVIPDGVISIGEGAFSWCDSLTNVVIGSGVTYIGTQAFSFCYNLASLTVDPTNPSYSSEGGVLFNRDKTVILLYPPRKSDLNYMIPDGVTIIEEGAFYSCSTLTNVTISSSVTNIGQAAFRGCYHLQDMVIPENVAYIGDGAFAAASMLSINADVANPFFTSLDGVLFNKDLTVLIAYPAGRTTLSYAIPANTVAIGNVAFYGSSMLTNIVLAESVVSIGNWAFASCPSLQEVMLFDSITNLGRYAFATCTNLTTVTFGTGITTIGEAAFAGCTDLKEALIPDSVVQLGQYVFQDCVSLTNAVIGTGVPSIQPQTFLNCTSLQNITIGSSVTNIDELAFAFCTNLTKVVIPASVVDIAFYETFGFCENLRTLFFLGNAPSVGPEGTLAFIGTVNAVVYFLPGTMGWESTLGGLPTMLWNPEIQTDNENFGVHSGIFGFDIVGTTNLFVTVRACTNLVEGAWEAVSTNSLSNGTDYFSDPDWINHPTRFYKLDIP